MKIIDDISNEEIRTLEIPTGVPLIYELNDDLKPVRHYHVGYALELIMPIDLPYAFTVALLFQVAGHPVLQRFAMIALASSV